MSRIDNYKERLNRAFPKAIKNDVETVCSILPLDNHNIELKDGKAFNMATLIHEQEFTVILQDETLVIPYRLYFDEPVQNLVETLNKIQKTILHCIYLRHHNGFVRGRHLRELIDHNEAWIIPHILPLLGEYVYELIEILDEHISKSNISFYYSFIQENPKYWNTIKGRVTSYWNEYYRDKSPQFKHYLGKKIIRKIEKNAELRE
ncbi:MAG: hypothetical protein ABJG68_11705 [Crocinitomicaceae bacterium]